MTLNGFDIYSGTPESDVVKALAADFVIVKATEGGTYVNPKHDEHVQRTRTAGRLVGHYHYAHPESNGPDTEARAFLRAVKALPGEVLVLDFEPAQILPVYPAWVIGFADVVTSVTGAPCWLYTNQTQGRALMSLATPQQRAQLALMPLWKAYYQMAVGDLMGWPSWACWQYTSSPMDANFFNGDAARWRALGVPQEGGVALTPQEIQTIADKSAERVWETVIPVANSGDKAKGLLAQANQQDWAQSAALKALTDAVAKLSAPVPAALSDADVQRIAVAVADEQARRQQD